MTEHSRAKGWREKTKLSVDDLAERSGYSREAIYLFEKGFTYNADGRSQKSRRNGEEIKTKKIAKRAWHRYRMTCAGVAAELSRGKRFDW